MVIQFGILVWFIWWEYFWDIMELVIYFIIYGSVMVMYVYFVMICQEYVYLEVRDR